MKTQNEIIKGQELTLLFDHWREGFKKGSKVIVKSTRKDATFAGGYRVAVLMGDHETTLAPGWFKELV